MLVFDTATVPARQRADAVSSAMLDATLSTDLVHHDPSLVQLEQWIIEQRREAARNDLQLHGVRHRKKSEALTEYHVFEDRDHWTCGAPGWEEVADLALSSAVVHAVRRTAPA